MKSYALCFLFNKNLDRIWLMKETSGIYSSQMNGISGKILDTETAQQAMLRILKEKAGLDTVHNIQYVGTLSLPDKHQSSIPGHASNILHYFAAMLPDDIEPGTLEQALVCHETEYIINRTPLDRYLAGGELPYFIQIGKERLMPK